MALEGHESGHDLMGEDHCKLCTVFHRFECEPVAHDPSLGDG